MRLYFAQDRFEQCPNRRFIIRSPSDARRNVIAPPERKQDFLVESKLMRALLEDYSESPIISNHTSLSYSNHTVLVLFLHLPSIVISHIFEGFTLSWYCTRARALQLRSNDTCARVTSKWFHSHNTGCANSHNASSVPHVGTGGISRVRRMSDNPAPPVKPQMGYVLPPL